jgi:hypothetical protein
VLTAQAQPAVDAFAQLRFLVGEWVGEGAGLPGQTSGAASFRFELEGKVLVRRSHADMAATKDRTASRHEDLMTLFSEGGELKAHYLDNEGHVIRYRVAEVPGGIAFISEPAPGPRFRLSYLKKAEGLVTVRFEIAAPGQPEAFSVYLEALTRKTK